MSTDLHDAPVKPASAPAPTPPAIPGVPQDERRAIVVGASSGMGAALVRQLAGEGYRVAALARRADKLTELQDACAESAALSGGEVLTFTHDVNEHGTVPQLFEEIVRALGGLDLIVYTAAIMPEIKADEYDTEKDLDQLSVNVGGCIAWCNEAARLMGTQRKGTLVGISSIAADRGRKANPVYGMTKAAMDHYLEALRNRLSEVGVHVCTIKPGFVDTAMTAGMDSPLWMISAEEAARQILRSARKGRNTRYVPWRWWMVGTIIKSIPSFIFKRLSI